MHGIMFVDLWLNLRLLGSRVGTLRMISSQAVCVACWWCRRGLQSNRLTGTLPTELGLLTSVLNMCVQRPRLSCMCVCTPGYYCGGQLEKRKRPLGGVVYGARGPCAWQLERTGSPHPTGYFVAVLEPVLKRRRLFVNLYGKLALRLDCDLTCQAGLMCPEWGSFG